MFQSIMEDIQIHDVRTLCEQSLEIEDITGYVETDIPSASLNKLKEKSSRYCRPPLSNDSLAFLALKNNHDCPMTVRSIHSFVLKHFPYFRTANSSWKKMIQHELGANPIFMSVIPSTTAKMKAKKMWALNLCKAWEMDVLIDRSILEDRGGIMSSMQFPGDLENIVTGRLKEKNTIDIDLTGEDSDERRPVPAALFMPEKTLTFTKFHDGVLPLITLYSNTPSNYTGFSAKYPSVT